MPSSLHHQAVERLGTRIVEGDLPAGDIVLAEQLEAELGVSRSVVREAVRVLQSLGMLEATKRVGIRVLPPSSWNAYDPMIIRWRLAGQGRGEQLRSLTELRTAVEPMAAELAALHAPDSTRQQLLETAEQMRAVGRAGDLQTFLELDIRFHAMVLASSGNEMFARLADSIAEILRGRTDLGLMPDHPHEQAMQWHVEVAAAIHARRPEAAREGMDRIMRRTEAELETVWQGKTRAFGSIA
ncbi:FadR family transcriptional regulator [Paenarthrobacter sp. DKR-5]|uniref:FadR/GntR family transcriptional regulator n=1 Tax=Paenarthrobacter sp. DKR-5 TaxID=2835535 RepID=UPI001BDBCFDF|nr:FadR/GntR family transcriptional regulator [Paenarthrobacter sp. DKR-5]MBT1003755.1 FadR family transcriptional regulator [Paenarthrobacter sp. DKR-5]